MPRGWNHGLVTRTASTEADLIGTGIHRHRGQLLGRHVGQRTHYLGPARSVERCTAASPSPGSAPPESPSISRWGLRPRPPTTLPSPRPSRLNSSTGRAGHQSAAHPETAAQPCRHHGPHAGHDSPLTSSPGRPRHARRSSSAARAAHQSSPPARTPAAAAPSRSEPCSSCAIA